MVLSRSGGWCSRSAVASLILVIEGCHVVEMCRTCSSMKICCQLSYISYGFVAADLQSQVKIHDFWQSWQFLVLTQCRKLDSYPLG